MLEIRDTDGKSPYKLIKDTIRSDTYKDQVFIADSRKGLFFKVFNKTGKWLYDINVNSQPKKIRPAYKEKALAKLFKESWWPQFKNRMEPTFPIYFPQIRNFSFDDDRLFVVTFIEKDNLVLLKTFDLKGKPLGKS